MLNCLYIIVEIVGIKFVKPNAGRLGMLKLLSVYIIQLEQITIYQMNEGRLTMI